MSHWVNIEVQIKDLLALADACAEMRLSFERAQQGQKVKARGYYGTADCDAVIRLKGPYDVALNRDASGNYVPQVDYYGGAAKEIGQNGCTLVKLYGAHKVMREMRAKGYAVTRTNNSAGQVLLSIKGGRL